MLDDMARNQVVELVSKAKYARFPGAYSARARVRFTRMTACLSPLPIANTLALQLYTYIQDNGVDALITCLRKATPCARLGLSCSLVS